MEKSIRKNGKRSVQVQIDAMVRRIARKFRPEQIILFGSHARAARPGQTVMWICWW